MPVLPDVFLDRPLAHRALHDVALGRPENSVAAIKAAMVSGYGIEIDLQLSRDAQAMVFHDDNLDRLTNSTGAIRLRDAATLGDVPLRHGDEGIPTLHEVLKLVGGQVPLLIELKDQDGAMGTNIGALEAATAKALANYSGPVAVMSFNPNSVAEMARLSPDIPRGLTTSAYSEQHWPKLPAAVRDHLRDIPDFTRTGASFISHDHRDLATSAAVRKLHAQGVPILCWTIRSPQEDTQARRYADNITFEGFPA